MFDAKAFGRAKFQPRTEAVDVPALADYFAADEPPVWVVRGLTAGEIARANDAESRSKTVDSIVTVLGEMSKSDQINELRDQLGIGTATHSEVIRRIEHLVVASVEPAIDMAVAVKLAETFPIEFYSLTSKILELTGKGQVAGKKPKDSGAMSE